MKKPFFCISLIAALLIIPSSLFTAASSSTGTISAQSELESILGVVAPLLQDVTHKTLAAYAIDPATFKSGDYYYDSETQQTLKPQLLGPKTAESEQKLRIQLDNAFEQAWPIHAGNDTNIALLKDDIKSAMINFFIESEFYRLLTACECISRAKRICFAVLTAHRLMQKNPNLKQKIVVTAFASGLLLQEYLLLKLLEEHGYTNVTANFVDFGYPDPVAFRRVLNQFKDQPAINKEYERIALKHYKQELIRASGITPEQEYDKASSSAQASSSGSESTDEEHEHAAPSPKKSTKDFQKEWIQENKELFPEFAELFGDDYFSSPLTFQKAFNRVQQLLPNTTLHSYKNAYDYIQFMKKYALKADMLTIVDPDLQIFDVAPFPSQANLLGLIPSSETAEAHEPDVFITLAKDQPVQLYVNKAAYDVDEFIKQDVIEKIRKKILKTGSDKKLSYVFRDWLIKFFGSGHNISMIEKLLEKNKTLLEQVSTSLSPEQIGHIAAELTSVQEGLRDYLEENVAEGMPAPLFSPENATAESILTYINNLQLWLASVGKDAFDLVWYSDPHLAFQTLVLETAKNDALIYLYYKYNASNAPAYLASSRFEEKKKSQYMLEDVFGPLVGATLLKGDLPPASEEDDEPIAYARVDLTTGNLITWDDIKTGFPEDNRSFKDFVRDDIVAVTKDKSTGKRFLNLEHLNITSPEELNNIPDIETVESLYLTHNNLGTIPPLAFSKFKNLEYITLDYNPSLTGAAFEGLEKLTTILIDGEDLSEEEKNTLRSNFAPEIFITFTQDDSEDSLTYESPMAVATDEATGDRYLYLANRNINSIEELNDIPDIDTVDSLYLTGNTLGIIEPGAFSRFKNLSYISLDYNPTLTGKAFEGLEKLKTVVIIAENLSEAEKDAIYRSFPQGTSILFIAPSE